MNYLDLTISEMHDALVTKKVTPLELTLEAIKRAKEDTNNAFETICEKEAIDFASKLIEPEVDNKLWGIPYVLKDNFSTKGIETTASSDILKGYIPSFDAQVVSLLKEKSCVLIGKTTLDELAMGGTGTTGHKGITYNPYDKNKERLCGGSSCGSAAACAAGIVPFAIGSDTGDSVRKPASFNALVGLKPTYGRISRYGLFPFAPSLDHVAYFTRSIEDSAIVLEVLAGRDLKDSTSSVKPVDKYSQNLNKYNENNVSIGFVEEIDNTISDKTVKELYAKFKSKLSTDYKTKNLSMDSKLLNAVLPTYFVISCSEAGSNNANLDGIKFGNRVDGNSYEEIMTNSRTKGFSELIKRRFVIGSYSLMIENQKELFLRAQKARRLIVNEYNKLLESVDVIISLSAPGIAPKFTDASDKLSSTYLVLDNHLAIQNFAGLPSITIPFVFIDNMPVGITLTAKAFEESKLLSVAHQLERELNLKNISVLNYKKESK